jgi:hypothetical protein
MNMSAAAAELLIEEEDLAAAVDLIHADKDRCVVRAALQQAGRLH